MKGEGCEIRAVSMIFINRYLSVYYAVTTHLYK